MQSSGIGSLGSMPTPDSSTFTTCSSDEVAKDTNATTCPDVELGTAVHTSERGNKTGAYVAGRKKGWSVHQKCNCLFKKSCIVTVPIIAFYATVSKLYYTLCIFHDITSFCDITPQSDRLSAASDQPQPITSDSNFNLTGITFCVVSEWKQL